MATVENPIRITEVPETMKTAQNIDSTEEAISGISSPQERLPDDIHVVDFIKVNSGNEVGLRACF